MCVGAEEGEEEKEDKHEKERKRLCVHACMCAWSGCNTVPPKEDGKEKDEKKGRRNKKPSMPTLARRVAAGWSALIGL